MDTSGNTKMSIEQKAKAYDEALKVIKGNLDALDEIMETGAEVVNIQAIKNCFYRAFPELKENEGDSEDERIKKWLIDTIKSIPNDSIEWNVINKSCVLDWLDKQGESDETKAKIFLINKGYPIDANGTFPTFEEMYNIIVEGLEYQKTEIEHSIKDKDDERLRKTTISFLKDFADKGYENAVECIDWLEKQKEQKPANKPKFNVGDWIIFVESPNSVYQVERIDNYRYYLRHCLGGTLSAHLDNELIRQWTIQDAKKGDVLHSTGLHSDCIFINNGVDNWKFDEPNGKRAVATGYCCLTLSADNIEFGIQGPDCIEVDTVKPATKEQRDLLFQKMREAGYEWLEETHKLKKKEQKPSAEAVLVRAGLKPYKDGNQWCILVGNNIQEGICGFGNTIEDALYEFLKGVLDFQKEQKSAKWGEEDEHRCTDAIYFLETAKKHYADTSEIELTIEWLKSLKPKPYKKEQ